MPKSTAYFFKLKTQLLQNKNFLVQIEKSKSKKRIEKLLKTASSSELDILRDLSKNIADKNIQISKTNLNTKKKFENIVKLIASFQRTSTINKSQASLRRFLLKFSNILPVVAKTVLK